MVPTKKDDLRKMVTQTTIETYEELTPQRQKGMIRFRKRRSRMRFLCICWGM